GGGGGRGRAESEGGWSNGNNSIYTTLNFVITPAYPFPSDTQQDSSPPLVPQLHLAAPRLDLLLRRDGRRIRLHGRRNNRAWPVGAADDDERGRRGGKQHSRWEGGGRC